MDRAPTANESALMARLEAEKRQLFEEAQREADAVFAQYQLSQLLASGGSIDELGSAILAEVVRLTDAASGRLWIARPGTSLLRPLRSLPDDVPNDDADVTDLSAADIERWSAASPGAHMLTLEDERVTAVLVLVPATGDGLDEEGVRVLQLSRHELAFALRAALLRTALEQERVELAAIVEGATDAIVQVDGDLRVLRLNGAAERMLGRKAADAYGLYCRDVLGCELAGGHREADCPLGEVIGSGRSIAYRETEVRGADGTPVHVAGGYSRSPVGPDGATRGTAILRDIRAARELEELREGFVATVSHELRTPLALIKGYADTLLHLQLEPNAQRGYVERIDQATERLTALVTQILDITHLDADPLVLERLPTRFDSLIGRLRGDLAVSGSAERLQTHVPADLPLLDVDAARVSQILDNLVSNALKYAPDGSPVTVEACVDGEWLNVIVSDQGIGVPEADASLVFEPFHRGRNVRETRISGSGLGLYISRRLVEAHGGQLRLERQPDGRPGTRALFTLPLAERSARRTQ